MSACANCGKHPGTLKWTEGAIAMIHGAYEMWCEGCALRAQIAHAEERAEALPGLRKKLAVWNLRASREAGAQPEPAADVREGT